MIERRIFVSASGAPYPKDPHFDFEVALLQRVREAGYVLEQFGVSGSALGLEWSHEAVERVMRRCVGVLLLAEGVGRSKLPGDLGFAHLGSDRHYEGAVATTLGLPLLVLKGEYIADSGVLAAGHERAILDMPRQAADPRLDAKIGQWLDAVRNRHDVFLAYCSKSRDLADRIHSRLAKAGARVRDWAIDFRPGQTILSEIEAARAGCTGGVFLFTEDDTLEGQEGAAAPRDNVIFEAGYFIAAKGAERCLIVRVGKARMPADLGGSIYLHVADASALADIEARLADFVNEQL